MTNVTSYSACIAEIAMRAPQRGTIHSIFNAAANIIFPDSFVLSLNAAATPRMPNGLQLSSPAGGFPFSALRIGMPVIFGAQRLHIEAIDCSLDLSQSPQWNPHIQRPDRLDMAILQKNYTHLKTMAEKWIDAYKLPERPLWSPLPYTNLPVHVLYGRGDPCGRPATGRPATGHSTTDYLEHETDILTLARYLCGRGIGLTPSGDDMLAGWMAAGWLLYGPEPAFLAACQHIVEIARQQTHILSSCWLDHASQGNVAEPIATLLYAMTCADDSRLAIAMKAVLAMGATSGYDLLQGILLASFIGYNR